MATTKESNAKSTESTEETKTESPVSEGQVASTPDNEPPEPEALPPITMAERDLANRRPVISPADESRVTAKAESKPESSEDVQKLLDKEAEKEAEKETKENQETL